MQTHVVKLKILWQHRLGILPVAMVMQYVFDGAENYWRHLIVALLFTTVLWEGNFWILSNLRQRFPRPDQTARRFLMQLPAHIVFTLVAGSTLKWLLSQVMPEVLCSPLALANGFVLNLIPTGLVVLVYETVYYFQEWKINLQRVEALARAAAQSELAALRQQLDPHFLFNSLNTLAALIDDEEPAQAQQYLSRLADVYRYVLLAAERETVSLREELAFVDAYVALNKVRFRENLIVENTIATEAHQRRVAPLSVQALVENALKHNIVSRELPLTLHLESAGPDTIQVRNPVRLRATLEPGTRTGLRNLVSRYGLLTAIPVEINTNGGEFRVSLPLL
jgi:hypothetical protein